MVYTLQCPSLSRWVWTARALGAEGGGHFPPGSLQGICASGAEGQQQLHARAENGVVA
jgi:hypothetical protein